MHFGIHFRSRIVLGGGARTRSTMRARDAAIGDPVFDLVAGRSRAAITGAEVPRLRLLEIDGTAVLDGFAIDELSPGGAGQVLSPWPNRLGGGAYVFGGTSATVPLNEPERNNAIHGLVRWREWRPTAVAPDSVTLARSCSPQPGLPVACPPGDDLSARADEVHRRLPRRQ